MSNPFQHSIIYKCVETLRVVATCVVFVFYISIKKSNKIYFMCCYRVYRKHNTHPREYVSICVSFTEKSSIQSPLRITYTA